jgi:hypothetical protein
MSQDFVHLINITSPIFIFIYNYMSTKLFISLKFHVLNRILNNLEQPKGALSCMICGVSS